MTSIFLFISETEQDRAISTKFLIRRVFGDSTGDFSQKLFFLPLLAAILNFCVKCKNKIISETEQDRVISMKFLTHRVYPEFTSDFSQKNFSRHFWRPSSISALNTKTC